MNKFDLVRKILKDSNPKIESLLDVGCRDCALKPQVIDQVKKYRSLDLFQNDTNSVDYVCNFETEPGTFDGPYDCVVALDLAEHLNDFSGGVNRLLGLTKSDLIIVLPNLSHLLFRLRFLFTGRLGDKYDLAYNMGEDRHRWVTILSQTDAYMKELARNNNLKLEIIHFTEGKKNRLFEKIGRFLHLPKSLYIFSILYRLTK